MKIGCLARYFNPYEEEVEFAKKNDFEFVQLWYDENGLSCYKDESIENVVSQGFRAIIHAVLDIYSLRHHVVRLIVATEKIKSRDLIIHPICESKKINNETLDDLIREMKKLVEYAEENDIKVHIENNSLQDPIFCSLNEYRQVFSRIPGLGFLIDIAHVDTVEELNEMFKIKYPEILHVAGRRNGVIHEHINILEGNFDFERAFRTCLNGFNGRVIIELLENGDIQETRNRLYELRNRV